MHLFIYGGQRGLLGFMLYCGLGLSMLLLGCTTTPPASSSGSIMPATVSAAHTGRLILQMNDSSGKPQIHSLMFDLQGTPEQGQLDLSTALGTLLAQAQWTPQQATLTSSQGSQIYPDIAALSQAALGQNIPLQALFDWLRARPWSGAPLEKSSAQGFTQLDWRIDLSRWDRRVVMAERTMPSRVRLTLQLAPKAAS
jgi:outer membrane lipoprotein LolB